MPIKCQILHMSEVIHNHNCSKRTATILYAHQQKEESHVDERQKWPFRQINKVSFSAVSKCFAMQIDDLIAFVYFFFFLCARDLHTCKLTFKHDSHTNDLLLFQAKKINYLSWAQISPLFQYERWFTKFRRILKYQHKKMWRFCCCCCC